MNKSICISKLLLFTDNNELIDKRLKIVDFFTKNEIDVNIIARNNSIKQMREKIPDVYKDKIHFYERGYETRKLFIDEVSKKNHLICMVGVVNEDAIFSFNCKMPLFSVDPMNPKTFAVEEKVKKYGLPIYSFQSIIDCFNAYDVHKGNYFQINFDNSFVVMSLNNANTYNKPENEARIKNIFQSNLKEKEPTRDQRILLLLLFHLTNEVRTNPLFEDVEFWGTFPSSDPQNTDTSVAFIKEFVRTILDKKPINGTELLIRKNKMKPKHGGENDRQTNKCNKDLETLIVNPDIIKQIKNKVVCIIDDYITNGYSAESAKHLLFKAGVKKVIFISMGKFGQKYYSTSYKIEGDITSIYQYDFFGETVLYKNYNGIDLYNLNNDKSIMEYEKIL